MLRLLLLICLGFGAYQLYHKGWPGSSASAGAFDRSGKPAVVLAVAPGCGDACDSIRSLLQARGMAFEEISVTGPDGAPLDNKYGIKGYPTTLVGKLRVEGDDLGRVTGALAETFGDQMLGRMERSAMAGHFDSAGKPKIVLYGTKWCGYCTAQRELFAAKGIGFDDVDVEASHAAKLAYDSLKGTGYPLTYVGYRRFSGFQETEILAAIDELVGK